jgi:hypothetical protein
LWSFHHRNVWTHTHDRKVNKKNMLWETFKIWRVLLEHHYLTISSTLKDLNRRKIQRSWVHGLNVKSKFFFLFFWGTCFCTYGFVLVAGTLPLKACPEPLIFTYFSEKVLHFYVGLALDHVPPTYVSLIAWITEACHHAWLICWDRA